MIYEFTLPQVGAGPAGLITALTLAKNSIGVRIIDRADTFHVGSRGFGIQVCIRRLRCLTTFVTISFQPRTFELFQLLGILDDVQELATPAPTMRAYKLPGGTQPVKTWDLFEKEDVWPDRPYVSYITITSFRFLISLQPNVACLSQDALEGVMRTHLTKYGITVELGKCLVALEQDADCVTATITVNESGQDEKRETVNAKYLVGTDGAKGNKFLL
jgi:2-polyprenyl-6-methoxyphenol hydroxylase-like FAD-dependent oxidoreductase